MSQATPDKSTMATSSGSLPSGVYVPLPAFFTQDLKSIDIAATQRHALRLAGAGVAGLVVHGSNGEAPHLSRPERDAITRAVVDAVRVESAELGRVLPVIAGCSGQSVDETVELCREAAGAGAGYALVLPPSYYKGLMKGDAVVEFFEEVSAGSPVPVLVYNYPGAANGVDLDSDTLVRIAERCPGRVVGVKLTCGNTGKLARVAHALGSGGDGSGSKGDFLVAGGSADFILQGAVAGARGTISGFANLAPRACVKILELLEAGELEAARELQGEVAAADWLAIQYGLVGVKAALPIFDSSFAGGKVCLLARRPLEWLAVAEMEHMMKGVMAVALIEAALEARASKEAEDLWGAAKIGNEAVGDARLEAVQVTVTLPLEEF